MRHSENMTHVSDEPYPVNGREDGTQIRSEHVINSPLPPPGNEPTALQYPTLFVHLATICIYISVTENTNRNLNT
jgi:hypothetical protein